jgi:hypothetical protein
LVKNRESFHWLQRLATRTLARYDSPSEYLCIEPTMNHPLCSEIRISAERGFARFGAKVFAISKINSIKVRTCRLHRLPVLVFAACAAAIFACGSQSARAAEPSFTPGWGKRGSPQAFAMLATYARCVVHSERGPTAKFLVANYPSKDRDAKAYDLISGAGMCIDRDLMLDFQFMRGALIEALYEADILHHSGKPLVALGTSAATKDDVPPPTELARCIVRRKPEKSAEVLRTAIASAQQAQAFAALEPDLVQCARETSSRPTFPELLRFQIAEELYRRAI